MAEMDVLKARSSQLLEDISSEGHRLLPEVIWVNPQNKAIGILRYHLISRSPFGATKWEEQPARSKPKHELTE
jgi:hypothetical protein